MSASTTTATAASRRSAVPTTPSPRPRATWCSAASIVAANIGVTRSACLPGFAQATGRKTFANWHAAGVTRADGQPYPQSALTARLWVPVNGGPAFLLGPNFYAVRSYNPSMNYTLAIVHLGDRLMGAGPFVQPFPGSERALTLAEIQEVQRRLTALGFDTGGTDGRVGNDTMLAVRNFQRKVGISPADGYAGLEVLAKLRR